MNENVDYVAKKPSKTTKFLWWCAGADEKILMYCSYSDHVKYLGIGGVVLATAFMAALSMGFALHTIFGENNPQTNEFEGNWLVTIPIALIWALIVFNLDRFIVSSTGKGDGESTISWSELGNATPRLLMATLLGLTISAPLETTIFDKEIQREWKLSMEQLATSKRIEIKTNESDFNKDLNKKVKKLEDDAVNQQKEVDKWSKAFEEEASGMRGGRGIGPEAKAMKLELDKSSTKLASIESERDSLRKIQGLNEKVIKFKQDSVANEIIKLKPGFLDKVMMLERLSSQGKTVPRFDPATNEVIKGEEIEIYGSAFWAIWLVRLLFMIIEIAPVVLKLMLIKSPYDYMGENVNQILEAKQGISMNHVTDEEGKLTKYKENFNPKRIIAIVEHQNAKEEENAKEAITLFAEKEKKEIAKNPDAFINPDESSS